MEWYHYGIAAIFFLMVISPVWFFRKVEKILLNNDVEESVSHLYVDSYINPMNIIETEMDITFERDEKVLNNIDRMIKNSRKRDTKKLWKIKKAEYLRNMRWKTLGGMEKTSHGKNHHPENYS